MSGKFIISLDCEGKWGVADRSREGKGFISNAKLVDVYSRILQLFEKYRFRATFAFVSALCLEPDELVDGIDGVELLHGGKNWLTPAWGELRAGIVDGWSCPELLTLVRAHGAHHVCTHGGTHLPYSNSATPSEAVKWDIEFARQHHARFGLGWGGIVFPRNVVGHLDIMAGAGIAYYRSMDRAEQVTGKLGKGVRLANEFVSADKFGLWPVGRGHDHCPVGLSPGKFINARIGFRRRVPATATLRRAKTMLRYASIRGRTFHLYTHPHNFINDEGMFGRLETILDMATTMVAEGQLEVMTMEDEFNGGA